MKEMREIGQKRRIAWKRRMMMICLVLILAVICILAIPFTRVRAAASEKTADELHYITYVVHTGDTLWEIADDHMGGGFDTHQTYIDEIMRANGLNSSHIYDGQLLIIPVTAAYTADSDQS